MSVGRVEWQTEHRLGGLKCLCLCSFLHLSEDHGADFLWVECLLLTLCHDFDDWLVARTSLDLEWPELDVSLADWVRKLAPNETLGVEHRVLRITGNLQCQTLILSHKLVLHKHST